MTFKHYTIPTDRFALKAVVLKFAKYLSAFREYDLDPESHAKCRLEVATLLAYVGAGRPSEVIMADYNDNRESFMERVRELPGYFAECTEALDVFAPMPKAARYSFMAIKERFATLLARPDFAALVDELMQAADAERRHHAAVEKLLALDPEKATREDVLALVKASLRVSPEQTAVIDMLTRSMSKEAIAKAFVESNEAADRVIASKDPLAALVKEVEDTFGKKPKVNEATTIKISDGLRAREVKPMPGETLRAALARTLAEDLHLEPGSDVIESIVDRIVKSAPEGTFDKRTQN